MIALFASKWARYGIAALAAILAIAGLYLWITKSEEADDRRNQEIGGTIQREANQREIIKRTEEGNEARNDIRVSDRTRYNQCLRTARTPENCERLLRNSAED